MSQELDRLLTQYEQGTLSRRELLGALALVAATAARTMPPPPRRWAR
ncbi:MAG: hypothetical protein R2712_25840 [Vicinamibacterales bacterium]